MDIIHKCKGGIYHYTINSMLYLRTIIDKYIEIYNGFISQLHIYAKAGQNFGKRLFTNFTYHTFEIARNSKFCQRDADQNQSGL